MFDFLNTKTARKLFEVDIPGIREGLNRLASAVEELVKTQQARGYGVPPDLLKLTTLGDIASKPHDTKMRDGERKLELVNTRLGLEMDDSFEHFKEMFLDYEEHIFAEGGHKAHE